MPAEGTDGSGAVSFDADGHTLASLFELAPDALLLLDEWGRVLWGNHATEELFGRLMAESIGLSAVDFVHPDDLELVLRSLGSIQGKEVGTLIEVRVTTPTGWRLIELIGRPVAEIRPGAILFSLRDVTDRRRFEVARDSDARLRALVHNAAFCLMAVRPDHVVDSCSAALTRTYGHDPELVTGRVVELLVAEEDRPRLHRALDAAAGGHGASGAVSVEVSIEHCSTGVAIPTEIAIVPLGDDPTLEGFVLSFRDVTQRSKAERDLREALSLVSATLESTADAILVVDQQGSIVSYNRRFAELWEVPAEVLAGRDDARVLHYAVGKVADAETFLSKVAALYSSPDAESVDVVELLDGRIIERHSKPQRMGNETVGRVWSFRDVTESKRHEASLEHRAFHDSLTGLANKERFLEELSRATAAPGQTGLTAVFFLDVDGLKAVNDLLGHLAGDQLLTKVAEVLRSSVRTGDTVARLGGDEFGVLAEHLDRRATAAPVAERILEGLRVPFSIAGNSLTVSGSLGVAFHEPGLDHLELLQRADEAMYSAKAAGPGLWAIYGDRPAASTGLPSPVTSPPPATERRPSSR